MSAEPRQHEFGYPVVALTPEFLLAGKAVFTVVSKSGERYTFRVKAKKLPSSHAWDRVSPDEQMKTMYFVQLLTGPENTRDYTYVGVLDPATGAVRLTAASTLKPTSVPYRVADWICKLIVARGVLPPLYELLPSSRCARCGRLLTVPASIKSGLGPECAGRSHQ